MVSLLSRAPYLAYLPKPTSSSLRPPQPAMSSSSAAAPVEAAAQPRKLPVLLFDVMDTLVRDPFYHHIPAFFQMSMKELLESKHPTAWSEFEKGLIDETCNAGVTCPRSTGAARNTAVFLFAVTLQTCEAPSCRTGIGRHAPCEARRGVQTLVAFKKPDNELAKKFFNDGRSFDLEGLKECMVRAYEYIDGVEDILCCLKKNNYEMHAFTNYPVWYQLIEDKLKLSKYLSWTFCSCRTGKRKPSPEFYLQAIDHLNVDPASCIFIDDRMVNIEAALSVGMVGLQFKNAEALRKDLCALGVELPPLVCEGDAQVQ
ncbi:flavin mononucleotide hydrolase 1, chloroplatic-like isoform X1 [Panicum virgatum]|uniref:flavin mononucleotide hydrolase 1, chloroplatic-like isoform X1 n=2 Tax=Panicum virgatum TaxID=38727 RepID=UPI0019D663D0|nr:flavin mononucleotide hydrolase 1, chloroplatic-like isoform X1 [Panicum virgatum]